MATERRFTHQLGQLHSLLVYGVEVVLPIEGEVPSFRVIKEVELEEAKQT